MHLDNEKYQKMSYTGKMVFNRGYIKLLLTIASQVESNLFTIRKINEKMINPSHQIIEKNNQETINRYKSMINDSWKYLNDYSNFNIEFKDLYNKELCIEFISEHVVVIQEEIIRQMQFIPNNNDFISSVKENTIKITDDQILCLFIKIRGAIEEIFSKEKHEENVKNAHKYENVLSDFISKINHGGIMNKISMPNPEKMWYQFEWSKKANNELKKEGNEMFWEVHNFYTNYDMRPLYNFLSSVIHYSPIGKDYKKSIFRLDSLIERYLSLILLKFDYIKVNNREMALRQLSSFARLAEFERVLITRNKKAIKNSPEDLVNNMHRMAMLDSSMQININGINSTLNGIHDLSILNNIEDRLEKNMENLKNINILRKHAKKIN